MKRQHPIIARARRRVWYGKGYKYQLKHGFIVQTPFKGRAATLFARDGGLPWIILYDDGLLFVREGYAWDGASGPTFDTENSFRGALAHDALYHLLREGKLSQSDRELADKFLRQLLIEDGMWRARAALWFRGVDWFAKDYAARRKEKILVAPEKLKLQHAIA